MPGVGALILEGDRILLVERAREPLKGWWSLPGGVLEPGELLRDAVIREVREETGLVIEPIEMMEIYERIMRDEEGRVEYHYVLMDFLCRVIGGNLAAADDACGAQWFARGELAALRITEGTLPVIERAFNKSSASHLR